LKLIQTNQPANTHNGTPRVWHRSGLPFRGTIRRTPRGTAEIELLLVIPVLLIILFIVGGMLVLGPARILNVFQAQQEAYEDATVAQTPGQNPNIQLISPPPDETPLDPAVDELQTADQLHQATTTNNVTIQLGRVALPTVTLTDQAEFTSPAWSYSSWPVASDNAYQWTENYASQSTSQWQDPLGLQDAWPP
jgi:hypothetical protein